MDEVISREDAMSQEDAMNMSDKQALKILKPMRDMMRDQHGCPISDAYFALERAIDALSAQQWIPCSERLPNYDEEVLVDYHGKVRLASLTKNDEEYPWYFIVNRFNAKLETVRAWMPLPDCYQGGEVI